ncbi:DEAD/DEAH box helicase [Bacillus cereus group sp. Bc256]|uniref:DEAD/DEAH box helicase n=1 Tax=Bacillus cereus group sp. Bc256 TaxID=3018102 RepID=UPI0022E5F60D|nr:DEAD/DEAH box helicase [Bacillus cereus group sp. Bc256]MDA2136749.1 DEAD/DEAH box helicase [Bacillus cereus group sp. Bc256]
MNEEYFIQEFYQKIINEMADEKLPPNFAKLYSQYTRIKMNQPSLKGWHKNEFTDRLNDAINLIDAGLFNKEIGGKDWQEPIKRGGELLEWLSHPELNKEKLPLRLLSAAAYQLGGYPALSMGLLNSSSSDTYESKILKSLLKGNFPGLFEEIVNYWVIRKDKDESFEGRQFINIKVIDEVVSVLGVLLAYMRWGDDARLTRAVEKFDALSNIMLDGNNAYSWLVSKLSVEVIREYINNSLRNNVKGLYNNSLESGREEFERYINNNYTAGKSLAWHSQIKGIERLKTGESFALCTPTGSGKTTIAELAIIQSLFGEHRLDKKLDAAPIVMYLVPSRALATEVEAKLSKVLRNIGKHGVKVTGLYGGTDWGPTDAWITSNDPTVLICTYEKGEALLRFLGPLFLERLSLIVIDEAHSVQFDGRYETLVTADNRSLRLEILANRLINNLSNKKVIALSAVADGGNQELSNWISGKTNSVPEVTPYRSTRQLIGRLEWAKSGYFEIRYDLLNGKDLNFSAEEQNNVPYIQKPFDEFPIGYESLPKKYTSHGIVKRQRPYLFWSALQLAKPDNDGKNHSVLISITQHINGYAEDFVHFFEKLLKNKELPYFFKPPTEHNLKKIWDRCLNSCEDYFGRDSYEYKLLNFGVVVHHGNMPGVMARLLVEIIEKRIVHVVLATSTLSEGVNLPFETVIIPTVMRGQDAFSISEFKNLVGRAGRPGVGTEGKSLVLLENKPSDWGARNVKEKYFDLINLLKVTTKEKDIRPKSPLGELLKHLIEGWIELSDSTSENEFLEWLEYSRPLSLNESDTPAEERLDTLDGILLSTIVEYEQTKDSLGSRAELEEYLRKTWSSSYANFVNAHNKGLKTLEKCFYLRGGAIVEHIYPDSSYRRQLYRTSLPPRYAKQLIGYYEDIRKHLEQGFTYNNFTIEEKLNYIISVIEQITKLKKFEIPEGLGQGSRLCTWKEILHWWLYPDTAKKKPNPKEISKWIKFVKKNFEYIFNWGLGSFISLTMDKVYEGMLMETSIEKWPDLELPWIVFWLKELIVWGTIDPVVSCILSHGIRHTRRDAIDLAKDYYENHKDLVGNDEIINASLIKEWVESHYDITNRLSKEMVFQIKVNLTRDFNNSFKEKWHVIPLKKKDSIEWIDPAGFKLAVSDIPDLWQDSLFNLNDFILDSKNSIVSRLKYV